ncbi:MAG: eukaryotic-like serine/threonine-protein kinase [Blastocatellia bacterium]
MANMHPERWRLIDEMFHAAVELSANERRNFLERACGGDALLRAEIDKLLDGYDRAENFIETPPWFDETLITLSESDEGPLAGLRLGAYEVIREIGRGGMGTVYLAARADEEFRKQVAIKLVTAGFDHESIIQRFRNERQILAGLDHPNIARLLDGGTTETGAPYFVMEYIEGETIRAYCDSHRLTTNERLKLFRTVCAAVHFAHQNLVVHRDIKPGNILVTADGTAKLLDFGVAKLLSPMAQTGESTEATSRAMTPEYASPEQARGETITTASDVYSLGVLLYELLAGHRPYSVNSRSLIAVIEAICEQEPAKPSTAVSRTVSAAEAGGSAAVTLTPEAVSKARGSEPHRLRRELQGDLDNIVLKAMRKEPQRRYASVEQFSEDIKRYFQHLPVLARQDTLSYRTSKFMSRHKAGVAAAALVIIALLAGAVTTLWQAHVARQERDKAERRFKDVRNLTNSFLFDFHDSIADLNGATKAREMVVKKAQEYLDSLAQEAGEDRELLWELSTAYLKLGDVQGRPGFSRTGDTGAALESYEKSLAARRRLAGLEPNNTQYQLGVAETLSRFGPIFQVLGKPDAAVEKMREAMEITDKLLLQSHDLATFITAFRNPAFLGDALSETGNYDEALAMYQKSLVIAEQMTHESFPEQAVKLRFAVSRERLGFVFGIKGEWQKSLDNQLEMLANTEALTLLEPASLDYARAKATAFDHVGDAYRGLRNYPKALENGQRGLSLYEEFLKKDPQDARSKKDVGDCSHHVAETLLAARDYRGALSLLQRTVSIRRGLVALDETNVEYPDDLAESLMLTGESLSASGNFTKAIDMLQEARAIREPIVSSHRQRIDYRRGLARLYTDLGEARAALNNQNESGLWYRKALDLWIDLQNQNALWAKEINMPKEVDEKLSKIRSASLASAAR